MARTPVPKLPATVLLADADVEVMDHEDLEDEDRKAAAWALHLHGKTQSDIGRQFDVSRQTINKWLKQEAARRRSVSDDVNFATERIVGQLEEVVKEAWTIHTALHDGGASNAMVGPQYLRLVLDAAKEIGRLRGFDNVDRGGARGPVEVVVKIGGRDDVAVGVRA